MPAGGAVIGAAGSIIGAGLGYLSAENARKDQKAAIKKAMAELEAVGYPPDLSKEIIYQQFEQAGILTPELEQDLSDSFAEVKIIKENPELRQSQLQALSQMKERAQVGLSAEDRAGLNQVRNEVQRDSEAKRQQIMQQMAARGQGGSGAELMMQLQAAQGASDQAAAGSDTLMAQAQQRALQALAQSADMASGIRSQDLNVETNNNAAINERNRFLAQNSIGRQTSNVNRLNAAQQSNLTEQQRIKDMNTAMTNEEKLRQIKEQGNLYDRSLGYAQAKSNAQMGQAAAARQSAQDTQSMFSQIGAGLGKAGAAAYQGGMFDGPKVDAAGGTTQASKDYLSGKTSGAF